MRQKLIEKEKIVKLWHIHIHKQWKSKENNNNNNKNNEISSLLNMTLFGRNGKDGTQQHNHNHVCLLHMVPQ